MYQKPWYLLAVILLATSLIAARGEINLNHATVARQLVHQVDWAAVGTISHSTAIMNYPMVNVISINDRNIRNQSTGHIRFILTDVDYTGQDWQHTNKATFLFSAEQLQRCSRHKPNPIDAMEPICPRVIISGEIKKLDSNAKGYQQSLQAFITRHPAAKSWLKVHTFYLSELEIKNIIIFHTHGRPHTVNPADYYSVKL